MDAAVLDRAADLFNRKLYFECHDLLEDAWAGTRGEERSFLQGLIHVSVGMYHVAAGNYRGAVSQLEMGLAELEPFGARYRGLDLRSLTETTGVCLDKARRAVAGADVGWQSRDIPRMEREEGSPSAAARPPE